MSTLLFARKSCLVSICVLIAGCTAGGRSRSPDVLQPVAPAGASATDLGDLHHAVSTSNAEAQRAFDQGLTLVYAFNHDEAIRSFKRALELDPNLAMAHWGIALALGPNYNIDVDPPREKMAFEEIHKAHALSKHASEPERDYIAALAARYSDDAKADLKKLASDYKEAMKGLSSRYQDDLDAATLYADSMMVLRPWKLWTHDHKPVEGTEEIVATLERVLKRNPNHVGANHLYIHATEGSAHPERAMEAAGRLPGLAPGAGHLVHMPSHVYVRVGEYEAAATSNEAAIAADQNYLKGSDAQGVYPMMYYSHNIHFLAFANTMNGRFAEAKKAAEQLSAHVGPHVKDMPMLEGFMPTPTVVLVSFHRWDEMLRQSAPEPGRQITAAMWHFGRGVAYAATGKIDEARQEREKFVAAKKAVPEGTMYGLLNTAAGVFAVAEPFLDARLALATNDRKGAVERLQAAVQAQDALTYAEPPDWYVPVRATLGAVLLQDGEPAKAEEVFRADLEQNPRSGRSLFGLRESLKAQGKNYAAQQVDAELQAAWKNADGALTIDGL